MSLQECYEGLNANYPLVKQRAILDSQKEAELSAITAKTLPQFNLNAQATYQSDVTEVPLPNTGIEPLNNDQYRATLTANQLIFNGGKIKATQGLQNIATDRKKQEVEVNLYQLKQRVNQLYFSILLIDDQTALLNVRGQQLQSKLKEVKSGIKNGVLLPTSDKVIEAELLKILQQKQEAVNNKSKLIASLSALIGISISAETGFQKPLVSMNGSSELNRPELGLYSLQKQEIEQQQNLLSKSLVPELNGFATGGYGNPGLNMLENDFTSYYIVGLKLNWNVFDWNGNKKQRQALDYSKELIDNQEEVFKLNTNTALNEQLKEIETLEKTIDIDQQLMVLQQEVVNTSESQLKNGVVTTSEYVTELTKLHETENVFNQHKTQLELAKANYNILKGDPK
ncbi:TolC family protein [Mangrovimonas sp. AS39]|uniref:TolC family protein n=1 Tax=Mangrovimonas futianensis TaxID=2895523 RepID=UPI001E366D52|nr:TolC family protein [Mangrovimonas futianensis]MCF1192264.1 TolC family protein [Mangrovimonas futianensis]MCF1195987.1 TolC family protein [Mangrovimonas futianensis]